MRVLITGAAGYIGSAAAQAVAAAGYEAWGLAHTPEFAAQIEALGGVRVIAGDLRDSARLTEVAASFGGIIHAGNVGGPDAGEVDARATRALLRGLTEEGVLVYTSGVWVLGSGSGDELSATAAPALVEWRPALEQEVLAHRARGVVLRPGVVYGRGAGIPGMLAGGDLPVIGDGSQHWALVHVNALAELYVLALAAARGSILHGVTHTLSMRDLGLLAAAGADRPLRSMALAEAHTRFGAFADALALDQQISAQRTRAATGWQPLHPSPIEEFLAGPHTAVRVNAAA